MLQLSELMVFTVISFVLTKILLPAFVKIFSEGRFLRPNFRGDQIPLGIGIVLYAASAVVITAGRLTGRMGSESNLLLFATGALALFGLVDDMFGTRHASGLMGHFRKMVWEGEVTTGALKALAGGSLALYVSAELNPGMAVNAGEILLNAIIIALSTNFINLLDLRPGRAGKGFLIMALLIAAVAANQERLIYLTVFLGSLAALLPLDLRSKVMMGDTGSNILGFILGFTAVWGLNTSFRLIYVVFLILVHVVTERYSLTGIIEKNRVLNYIDLLGRK